MTTRWTIHALGAIYTSWLIQILWFPEGYQLVRYTAPITLLIFVTWSIRLTYGIWRGTKARRLLWGRGLLPGQIVHRAIAQMATSHQTHKNPKSDKETSP